MSEFKLTTTSFQDGGMIPKKYTPHAEDYNPQLSWTGAPAGTKSFALINDDPDAPDAIEDLSAKDKSEIKAVYSVTGTELPTSALNQTGIYVVKYNNGASKKIVVK